MCVLMSVISGDDSLKFSQQDVDAARANGFAQGLAAAGVELLDADLKHQVPAFDAECVPGVLCEQSCSASVW